MPQPRGRGDNNKRVVKIQLIVILFVYCFLITVQARRHANIFLGSAPHLIYCSAFIFHNLIKTFMDDILKCIILFCFSVTISFAA